MEQYGYAITVHKADEILATIPDLMAGTEPPVVYSVMYACQIQINTDRNPTTW